MASLTPFPSGLRNRRDLFGASLRASLQSFGGCEALRRRLVQIPPNSPFLDLLKDGLSWGGEAEVLEAANKNGVCAVNKGWQRDHIGERFGILTYRRFREDKKRREKRDIQMVDLISLLSSVHHIHIFVLSDHTAPILFAKSPQPIVKGLFLLNTETPLSKLVPSPALAQMTGIETTARSVWTMLPGTRMAGPNYISLIGMDGEDIDNVYLALKRLPKRLFGFVLTVDANEPEQPIISAIQALYPNLALTSNVTYGQTGQTTHRLLTLKDWANFDSSQVHEAFGGLGAFTRAEEYLAQSLGLAKARPQRPLKHNPIPH